MHFSNPQINFIYKVIFYTHYLFRLAINLVRKNFLLSDLQRILFISNNEWSSKKYTKGKARPINELRANTNIRWSLSYPFQYLTRDR